MGAANSTSVEQLQSLIATGVPPITGLVPIGTSIPQTTDSANATSPIDSDETVASTIEPSLGPSSEPVTIASLTGMQPGVINELLPAIEHLDTTLGPYFDSSEQNILKNFLGAFTTSLGSNTGLFDTDINTPAFSSQLTSMINGMVNTISKEDPKEFSNFVNKMQRVSNMTYDGLIHKEEDDEEHNEEHNEEKPEIAVELLGYFCKVYAAKTPIELNGEDLHELYKQQSANKIDESTSIEFITWCHSSGVFQLLIDHYDAVIEDMNELAIPDLEVQI
jgi:hypothetical protein